MTTPQTSPGWEEMLNTAQSVLTAIQRGGSYQITAGPYLSNLSMQPTQPNLIPWLIVAGLGVAVMIMIMFIGD